MSRNSRLSSCSPGTSQEAENSAETGWEHDLQRLIPAVRFLHYQNLSPEGSTEFKIIPQAGAQLFKSRAREDISDLNHNTRQAQEASVNRNSHNFCTALKNRAVRRLPDLGLSGEYTISSHVTSPTRSLAATILNCDFSR